VNTKDSRWKELHRWGYPWLEWLTERIQRVYHKRHTLLRLHLLDTKLSGEHIHQRNSFHLLTAWGRGLPEKLLGNSPHFMEHKRSLPRYQTSMHYRCVLWKTYMNWTHAPSPDQLKTFLLSMVHKTTLKLLLILRSNTISILYYTQIECIYFLKNI
jgi:hypothetical protein